MSEKKYWQNFGEFHQTEEEKKQPKNEFNEALPFEDLADEGLFSGKTPRRDFLKYMGFSTVAAIVAASCEMPVRKAVPYLNKPDDMVPGIANFYASTYVNDGDAIPVVVKQREGRPIKIEGNDLSSLTDGGTSAQCQSSVLDLYDTTRLRYPMIGGKEATFEAIDKMIADDIAASAGKPFVLLTSSVTSPTTKQIISEFLAKYPGSRHVQYDAMSYSGLLLANQASYGRKAIPAYHFENAKVIVSIGADFVGTWLSPVVFANQYSRNRRINEDKPEMSKHYQFESYYTITGASADDRYLHKPSETGAVVLALLAALNGGTPSGVSATVADGIKKAAADLLANKGAGLVVCGSNDPNIQIIVNAINEAIGAGGKTIDWGSVVNYRQGIDADMVDLISDVNAGKIGGLFIYGANPAYNYYDADKFIAAVKKCPLTVSYNEKMDETTELCKYVIPSHHWLECWGDAELQTGYVSVIQPIIHPLFKTRQFETSLLKLTGDPHEYETYFRAYWLSKLGSVESVDKFLQNGVIENGYLKTQNFTVNTANLTSASAGVTASFDASDSTAQKLVPVIALAGAAFTGNVADATAKIQASAKGSDTEIALYQNISVGTGSRASNAWLQEVSDPITKATWDNYAVISPQMGKSLFGIDIYNPHDMDKYEVDINKPVIKITVNGKTMKVPALIMPGIHPNVIAIAVGYGRQSLNKDKTAEYIGPAAKGTGVNVYPLASYNGTSVSYSSGVTVEKTDETYIIAQTQVHQITEGRPVIRETTLADFIARPDEMTEEVEKELKTYGENFERDGTLYPTFDKPGVKWGMSIDLNTCIGCSACTVACVAENNISTVGKYEVRRFHDMQWIRIDRYYTGDPQNPDVVFQPMLCQQCDNAPCENVCPVDATNHSDDGLNQMIYNRCIGTKYCANNCPYKVRRFNWADWNGADSFPDNQTGIISDATMQLNDDLMRMVLNPDVTVRSRGVMEKCSFCVQRLQLGKLNAKKENRPLKDMEVKTACMQACPTHAIVFGNVNDKDSQISKMRLREQKERKFYVLEELHTLPNVNYLEKIRNTQRAVGNMNKAKEA
ncbi:MAG TPA: TAT-variant-translocated molybdopterin oxidoreductase [Chitinophagaceae bacterium]|nr:TAT-variant-translocated molybdopterin oxidoreductase [Chitinophagaceae bacterium]